MDITVYCKNNCAQCSATKRALDRKGIEYKTINIEDAGNEHYRDALLAEGFMQMPVVKINNADDTANEQSWSGYRPDLIKSL